VKSRIALYKYPRWIEFVEALPKNDRGKIDRKRLKDQSDAITPRRREERGESKN